VLEGCDDNRLSVSWPVLASATVGVLTAHHGQVSHLRATSSHTQLARLNNEWCCQVRITVLSSAVTFWAPALGLWRVSGLQSPSHRTLLGAGHREHRSPVPRPIGLDLDRLVVLIIVRVYAGLPSPAWPGLLPDRIAYLQHVGLG